MSKLSGKLGINTAEVRVRDFEINGQKFKLRVPLAKEAEQMWEKAEKIPEDIVEARYQEITKDLQGKKSELEEIDKSIKFTEKDILVTDKNGKKMSMRQMAKDQLGFEIRVVETVKLLITVDGSDLSEITYADINEEFPMPIQITLVKKISEVISPSYEDNRKN